MDAKNECSTCGKELNNMNNHNASKHLESCKATEKKKKDKAKRKLGTPVTKYFSKVAKKTVVPNDTASSSFDSDNADTSPHASLPVPPDVVEDIHIDTEENNAGNVDISLPPDDESIQPVDLTVAEGNVSTGDIIHSFPRCMGYRVMAETSIYKKFPFQLLPDLADVVFERDSFHHETCSTNHYILTNTEKNPVTNDACFNLENHVNFQSTLKRSKEKDIHLTTQNNKFLTYDQLIARIDNMRSQRNTLACKTLNNTRKIYNLGKSLELHQRFLLLIKENKVDHLHELVSVALRNTRSIGYIVSKLTDAINGRYSTLHSEDDKDLAFLILQFGGPALLEIVHRAINLPSTTTA